MDGVEWRHGWVKLLNGGQVDRLATWNGWKSHLESADSGGGKRRRVVGDAGGIGAACAVEAGEE